jgi:gliding motility-associated-like protein
MRSKGYSLSLDCLLYAEYPSTRILAVACISGESVATVSKSRETLLSVLWISKFLFCIIFLFHFSNASAQNPYMALPVVLGSSGSWGTLSFGNISYTIGEPSIKTIEGNTRIFSQGFHQPDPGSGGEICAVYIPNAFTPFNGHVNDTFLVFSACEFDQFQLLIYDRLGKLVFESGDSDIGWEGYINGEKAQQAIYTWALSYRQKKGDYYYYEKRTGTVMLIR